MVSEFGRIRAFTRLFDRVPPPGGPGDDCAVVPAGRGELCVTTDGVVEDVHFTRAHFRLEDVGHKALAVNLSDLAAMGAEPEWFLCAIAHPASLSLRDLQGLARGMSALARAHQLKLVGGNFSRASELSVTITAAGRVKKGRALTRDRGRPGDRLFVTGTLGEARLGLEQLRSGLRRSSAIDRQRRPQPRIAAGRIAGRFASAAIDLSDGLAQDLRHLCDLSRTGARIRLSSLPISEAVRAAIPEADRPGFALAGGEDYELLIAVPPQKVTKFVQVCASEGERVTEIGHLAPAPLIRFLDERGARVAAPPGFDHFAPAKERVRRI